MGFQIYDSSGRLKTNSVQTVDTNLLSHPGYREDQTTDGFYLGQSHSGGTDAGTAHGNFVIYQPWFFPYGVTIKAMTISGDDAGNTGNLRVAMYNNSKGLPTSQITSSVTNMTGNGTGDTEVSVSFKIDAGWYWMASVETSGDIDIEQTYSSGEASTGHLVSQAAAYYNADWGTYHESGSALPATAAAASRAQSSYIPRIGLRLEAQ